MAEERASNPGLPSGEADERLAALIRAERAAILASYAKSLEAAHNPIIAEPGARDQALIDAAAIINDIAAGLASRDIPHDGRCEMLPLTTGGAQTQSRPSPADLLRAGGAFFEVTVSSLADHVRNAPELLPCFITVIVALNDSISRWIREATLAHTSYLLERIDYAHVDERHRIARDLHDQLGEGLSGALRQLELHELTEEDPATPGRRVAMAKGAITEAMRRLRVVASDLRQDSVRSLEKSLIQYIDSVAPDVAAAADVRLRVSGDETWAPPAVIHEAFLILREAIRNALSHGAPRTMLIGVAFAPHELYAWVEDDGCGFVLFNSTASAFSGTGLTAMRERAGLIGGRLTVASVPGQGTYVELLVPLPGTSR